MTGEPHASKTLSLVQQKRLQWAREREELVGLCGLWGPDASRPRADHIGVPSRRVLGSTSDVKADADGKAADEVIAGRHRRPSLPPIGKSSQVAPGCRYQEEESSGYASDSAPSGQEHDPWEQQGEQAEQAEQAEHRVTEGSRSGSSDGAWREGSGWAHQLARPSVSGSSCCSGAEEAGRARWGDRGVGVGHLWEPTEDGRLPPVQGLPGLTGRGAPGWLQRGLRDMGAAERDSDVGSDSAADRTSTYEGEDHQMDNFCRSFLRGQNVPLEADILLERQKKRERALEHQTAIRQQLEERDRRRREERERRQREERLEEERLRREQEQEQRLLREEQRRQAEKQEQESRRAAAMLEALQQAERQAREQRLQQHRRHVNTSPTCEDAAVLAERLSDMHVSESARVSQVGDRQHHADAEVEGSSGPGAVVRPKREDVAEPTDERQAKDSDPSSGVGDDFRPGPDPGPGLGSDPRSGPGPGPDPGEPLVAVPQPHSAPARLSPTPRMEDAPPTGAGWFPVVEFLRPSAASDMKMPFPEGLAVVIPAGSLSAREAANTVSTAGSAPASHRHPAVPPQVALLVSPLAMDAASRCPGCPRLLTPTKFRRRLREAATQTSAGLRRVNPGASRNRSSGSRQHVSARSGRAQLGERPKWGVNRPGTQYRTQSEKDPYYRQRLQRLQRRRQPSGSGSGSAGSRSPSPSARLVRGFERASPSDSGDLLSRTYRICRADEPVSRAPGVPAGAPARAPVRDPAGGPARGPARDDSVAQRPSGSNSSLCSSSGSSSSSSRGPVQQTELLSHLSSFRQGLLLRREQLDSAQSELEGSWQ